MIREIRDESSSPAAMGRCWRRVGLAGLLGAFGFFAISSIYWNWYGVPNAFFLAQGVDMVVGWSLAGAVIAKLIPVSKADQTSERSAHLKQTEGERN